MTGISDDLLLRLAQEHATPLWVYDAAVIRDRIRQLHSFDVVRFTQKACSNIHILSLMRDAGVHQEVCRAMTTLIRGLNHDFEAISAGGGLSVPYRSGEQEINTDHYFSLWDEVRRQAESLLGHPLRLEIEPGRYLVADAGLLIGEVRATKQMGGNHFTLVDAGSNDLMRPALYGSYHPISVLPADGRMIDMSSRQPTVVAGPLCESGDVFTQGSDGIVETRDLPSAAFGDFLVFHKTGAYGASMSSNYNSRLHAPEYLVDGARSRLIRRRQTIDDLCALEMQPRIASNAALSTVSADQATGRSADRFNDILNILSGCVRPACRMPVGLRSACSPRPRIRPQPQVPPLSDR